MSGMEIGSWPMASSGLHCPPMHKRSYRATLTPPRSSNARTWPRVNKELETSLQQKGLVFNYPERNQFRDALNKVGFYAEWRKKFGAEPWAMLEKYAGTLGG